MRRLGQSGTSGIRLARIGYRPAYFMRKAMAPEFRRPGMPLWALLVEETAATGAISLGGEP